MDQEQNTANLNGESLEPANAGDVLPDNKPAASTPPPKPAKQSSVRKLFGRFNIYLVLFIFILIIAGVIVFIAFSQSKKQSNNNPNSVGLSNSTLQQIANGDAAIGGPQQVLNVESNAVFAGKVLVNQGLSVAGTLQVSGDVGFQNINASGNTQLQSANIIKNLSVGGSLGVSGSATVNSLQVNGDGSFSGTVSASQLTTASLTLSGNLVLDHHISVGGVSPTSTTGTGVGSGGTANVNGSDTSGAIDVHIGGGPSAGCFITVKFNQVYNQTPYVIVSPVGASGAGLPYYVNASSNNFSLCSTSAAPANSSFSFDYFVVE